MANKNSLGAFISGLTVGTAMGTVIGLLIAPRTGKETRKIIRKTIDAMPQLAEDLSTTMQIQGSKLSASTISNLENTLARLKDALAAGLEASKQEIAKQQSKGNLTASDSTEQS